jgi:ADP-ribosyl-[dinitrogen reductase] hydrolase
MINCFKIYPNIELYDWFLDNSDNCTNDKLIPLSTGNMGQIYKTSINAPVKNKLDWYIVKKQPLTPQSIREKQILKKISSDMLANKAPILFSFLYNDNVCENNIFFTLQPAEKDLAAVISQAEKPFDEDWWAAFLYQLSKAVYYLEENQINHNDLNFENIMFQQSPTVEDPMNFIIMIIDFGSAGEGHLGLGKIPPFTLGRDLNYFLYTLLFKGVPEDFFPKTFADKLYPFIGWNNLKQFPNENNFNFGLRKANLIVHNWKSSGKNISRWLTENYNVGHCCSKGKMEKARGVGIGAMVGDAFGVPLEFATLPNTKVTKMYGSGKFDGLLSSYDLLPGTFSDDTQMSLALIDAIFYENKVIKQQTIARAFKKWADSDPIDIGSHTATVLAKTNKSGNNWEKISYAVYNANPDSAANGATMRCWPIAVLYCNDFIDNVITGTIQQSQVTHMNNDAVYAAVFVNVLIYKLINDYPLEPSIKQSIDIVRDFISEELLDALESSKFLEYSELNGGHGWIVHTMQVVMWTIQNTFSFKDALIAAINVGGDADTNAAIAGAICGAIYGVQNIPQEWINSVNAKNPKNIWNKQQITTFVMSDICKSLSGC